MLGFVVWNVHRDCTVITDAAIVLAFDVSVCHDDLTALVHFEIVLSLVVLAHEG